MSYPGRSHTGSISRATAKCEKSAEVVVGGNTEGLNNIIVAELSVMLSSFQNSLGLAKS